MFRVQKLYVLWRRAHIIIFDIFLRLFGKVLRFHPKFSPRYLTKEINKFLPSFIVAFLVGWCQSLDILLHDSSFWGSEKGVNSPFVSSSGTLTFTKRLLSSSPNFSWSWLFLPDSSLNISPPFWIVLAVLSGSWHSLKVHLCYCPWCISTD